jgi:prepilin-type processing-associated H-X9-DG protein
MGIALHHYSLDHDSQLITTGLPFDYMIPATPATPRYYWFGAVIGPTDVDRLRGFLMPYAENVAAIEHCPTFDKGTIQLRYQGATSGYAYNPNLGSVQYYPPDYRTGKVIEHKITRFTSTSETIAFADSAEVWWWDGPEPYLRESFILSPPSSQFPNVHFRHSGRSANVLFLDGHVDTMMPVENPLSTNPPNPWGWPQLALDLKHRAGIADLSLPDTLYDRE